MFNLVNLLKKHRIVPCFVFDGKPPEEKKDTLAARREAKQRAADEYAQCLAMMETDLSEEEAQELTRRMEVLKTKMTRINQVDVQNVKDLLTAMGVTWVTACGEADGLCAKMAIRKHTDAVMSEDMDMFLFGVPMVWRHISLLQETVIMYDLKTICSELNLTPQDLKEICVASGTDYNANVNKSTNLANTIKLFRRFQKSGTKDQFYEWLDENTDYIDNMCMLYSHLSFFDPQFVYMNQKVVGKRGTLRYKNKDMDLLRSVMAKENFYFCLT
jgi:flap endonuclease-1